MKKLLLSFALISAAPISAAWAQSCLESELVRLETESNATVSANKSDGFARAVAIEGDVAVVGFPTSNKPGSVYIYERDVTGWVELRELTLAGETNQDLNFGWSVSISGDRIAVGTAGMSYLDGTSTYPGVYIYDRGSNDWGDPPTVIPFPCQGCFTPGVTCSESSVVCFQFWEFGKAVDIDGDRLAIAAPMWADGDSGSSPVERAVFVYEFSAGSWSQAIRLENPVDINASGSADNLFGETVAISGDFVLVGAEEEEVKNGKDGAVYVYRRGSSGWTQDHIRITSPEPDAEHLFGSALDIVQLTSTKARAVIGEKGNRDLDTSTFTGTAYVFEGDDALWTHKATLDDSLAIDGSQGPFGFSVSLTEKAVVVGRPREDPEPSGPGIPGGPFPGDYIDALMFTEFSVPMAPWSLHRTFSVGEIATDDGFTGYAVAIDDDYLVSGDPNNTVVGGPRLKGNAYVFQNELDIFDDCDLDGIPDDCEEDANNNDIPDDCEVDCDGIGGLDYLQIQADLSLDCNLNALLDSCEIADNPDLDQTTGDSDPPVFTPNGIIDGCEIDCNGDGTPDAIEISLNPTLDCNGNGRVDECEFADGISLDVNGNGVPDDCDADCNRNGIPDDKDIADATSLDCDGNGVPDECVPCPLQVIFVVDVSESMGQFGLVYPEVVALAASMENGQAFSPRPVQTFVVATTQADDFVGTGEVPCEIDPGDCTGCVVSLGQENWGAAVALIAQEFPWDNAGRVIIAVTDEGACDGGSGSGGSPSNINAEDVDAAQNAKLTAIANNVVLFAAIAPHPGTESDTAVLALAADHFITTYGDVFEVDNTLDGLEAALVAGIDLIPFVYTNECGCGDDTACVGDADSDGDVDSADLNLLLANFGRNVPRWTLGDENGDGIVNSGDLNLLLAAFGNVCFQLEAMSGAPVAGPTSFVPRGSGGGPQKAVGIDYTSYDALKLWVMASGYENIDDWFSVFSKMGIAQQKTIVDQVEAMIDWYEQQSDLIEE